MSDLSIAALEKQAAMGGSIGADILGTTAGAGLGPIAGFLGPASLFASILYGFLQDEGLQETPMTPEERIAFENTQRLALASQQLGQNGEGAKETVLDAIDQAVADGVNQAEIDYVTELLRRGDVTVEDVSISTGIPESEIQAVYDQQRRAPSPLELLQTGPVQPEEEVDLAQRTTDDLTQDTTAADIEDGITDGDVSSRDSDLTIIPENPWIYQGGGVFRNERTGETEYNEDAANNPAYVIGGSYSGPDSGTQDVETTPGTTVNVVGGIGDIATVTPAVTNGGLVGDTVVQTPTGTPGTVQQVTGDGTGDGTGGTGDGIGDGVRSGLIMMLSQQAPITEQMFSRELFEPQMKELNNVAKALGMLQSIARPFV